MVIEEAAGARGTQGLKETTEIKANSAKNDLAIITRANPSSRDRPRTSGSMIMKLTMRTLEAGVILTTASTIGEGPGGSTAEATAERSPSQTTAKTESTRLSTRSSEKSFLSGFSSRMNTCEKELHPRASERSSSRRQPLTTSPWTTPSRSQTCQARP